MRAISCNGQRYYAKRLCAVSIFLCALLFLLGGCGSSDLTIGDTNEKTSFSVVNKTGDAIEHVAIKDSSSTAYPDGLTQDGNWEVDKTAVLYCPPCTAETGATAQASEDAGVDVELLERQDIKISTAGGMTYELHQLNLADIKDAELCVEGSVAYLIYTSKESNEQVNTLEAEKAYLEQVKQAEEQAAAAEETARLAAEQEAQKQAQAKDDQPAQTQSAKKSESSNTSSSSSSSSSNSGSSSKPSGSSGSSSSGEDACVDDLILE